MRAFSCSSFRYKARPLLRLAGIEVECKGPQMAYGGVSIRDRTAWFSCAKALQSRNGLAPQKETFDSSSRRLDCYWRRFLYCTGPGVGMGWRVLASAGPAR